MSNITEPVVRIGDRMRMSVALIRQIAENPDGTSPIVVVSDIRREDDGTIILVMSHPESS